MAGKGGGAWKVAYADFVTAMMAFFMVMWLMAQGDKVKKSVAEAFRNETGKYAVGDSLLPPRRDQKFREQLKALPDGDSHPNPEDALKNSRRVFALAVNNGSRTVIGTVIQFAPDSAKMDQDSQSQLTEFVPLIIGKPQKLEVRGHAADSVQQSTESKLYAWNVSYERCLSVMQCLIQNGIPLDRIRLSQAGSTEPYVGPETDDRHSRVEVFVLNEVADCAVSTQKEREHRFKSAGE